MLETRWKIKPNWICILNGFTSYSANHSNASKAKEEECKKVWEPFSEMLPGQQLRKGPSEGRTELRTAGWERKKEWFEREKLALP